MQGRVPCWRRFIQAARLAGASDLNNGQLEFTRRFVQRPEFVARYQTQTTGEDFVDALTQSAQSTATDVASMRQSLLLAYNQGSDLNESRALTLRAFASDPAVMQAPIIPCLC